MRINKFIASYSKFSRRKADELIEQGRVFLNGKKITELGIAINPEKDIVKIDNTPLNTKCEKVYFALHKPEKYLSTRSDEHGRKTIMDLLPKIPNLKPVGRLDYETEGLILASNDGEFINKHTHPAYECEKEYFVISEGLLTENEKEKLEKGIFLENKKTARAKVTIEKISPQETILKITIHEGRNRQIRKMFDSINHPVKYLKRLRIGNTILGNLKKGSYRPLTPKEINAN
ncbi:MAG: pseudouridine synthase [Candidatus Gracilibacteria bacterium]|nr:pseudouridine synthase [Candidatus Gracilibacteria bacterium]